MHLDRLMTVLETVAIAGRAVSPADVQRATGIPRPTCYRLLQTLAEHRLLDEADENASRYLIGERLKRITMLGQLDRDVCQVAAPTLKEAAIDFGEAVFLSRFREKDVEIIHVETPVDAVRSFIHPGLGRRPIHACSCSKAIAAFADKAFQSEVLSRPLRAFTHQTKTDSKAIDAEFSEIRERGFAECVEEMEVGVSSVAAPIRIGTLGVPFSVGATGPMRRFGKAHREKLGRSLIGVADQIASNLQLVDVQRSGQ